jgi:hypothetical protein
MLNYLAGQMEATVGLPRILPRFPERRPAQIGGVTLNHINIDRSTIGVLNTGNIERVDAAVTVLKQQGASQAGEMLKHMTEAVATAREVDAAKRNEMLELLSVLANEAAQPPEKRRPAAMRPLLSEMANLVSGSASLLQLWQHFAPALAGLFGLG